MKELIPEIVELLKGKDKAVYSHAVASLFYYAFNYPEVIGELAFSRLIDFLKTNRNISL